MATHIIASTLPPKKSVDLNRYRIVKPAWIMDSIAAGKLLSWTDYRVLDEGPRQKVLNFDGAKGLTQESPKVKQGYREQTDNSFYTSQIRGNSWPTRGFSQFAEKRGSPSSTARANVNHPESSSVAEPTTRHVPESKMADDQGITVSEAPSEESTPVVSMASEALPHKLDVQTGTSDPPQGVTSEEHNAWLLSDPRLAKSSTANPDFIQQYYSESRLHHLSTWKADLKSRMQRLAAERGLDAKNAPRRKAGSRRYIMHVDFDSFFCAVSLKRHPEYVDKPTVVAHSAGSGSEIASCNYPARGFGVKNGMWMKKALELCPDLKVLPYDFPGYEDASKLFYEAIMDVGGTVQSVSIDEALIDITSIVLSQTDSQGTDLDESSIWREQDKSFELATILRRKVKEKTGCNVSIGIGGNILQAKVALRKAKPAGQYHLKPDDVLDVIGELQVENLPGVAYSIRNKLEEIGVKFVKDLRELSKEKLISVLGPKTGERLRDYARGIDNVEVGAQPPRKSVSAEVNWGIRFLNQPEADEFVHNLCKELERRLLNEGVKGKQLTMKIMRRAMDAPLDPAKHLGHGKCDTFNRATTFGVSTNSCEIIGKEAVGILRSFKFSPGDLRGLGVQMTKLEPIKSNPAAPEGSQRKLVFPAFAKPSPGRTSAVEGIDEDGSPQKPKRSSAGGDASDPIDEDPLTPRKPKTTNAAVAKVKTGYEDDKATTPLNVSGTQFLIPSNADPAVLAALPGDIYSKLMAQARPAPSTVKSRSESPAPFDVLPSQVDGEVFNALPDDVKAEVLATYGRSAAPQSPHKSRPAQPKRQASPSKRGGIKGMFSKAQRQRDEQAGLLQTSLRNLRAGSEGSAATEEEPVEELDAAFLAELPEDVRQELIEDHRRRKLARNSGLDAPPRRQQQQHHHNPIADGFAAEAQPKIRFPAPPPKVSFAMSGVTSAREIKDMLDAWHSETRNDGPHRGDVEVFEKYLVRVITEERDAEKAVKLVKWLDLIVEQDGSSAGRGQELWRKSVSSVKGAVQGAAKQRGLAPLKL